MEIVGTGTPSPASLPPSSRPVGQWGGRGLLDYDPERHDLPSAKAAGASPFDIPTEEYVKRFALRKRTVEGGIPQVEAVMQTPTIFREGGRWRWRLKPTVIRGPVTLFQQYVEASPMKWALESHGNPFDTGAENFSGATSATSLIDANEFIPLLNGPFYKQLYQADYLAMHARCLVGSTPIPLLDGTTSTLAALARSHRKKSFWVYAYDARGRIVPGRASAPRRTGRKQAVIAVTLDNGKSITCTPEHLFMLRDGTYRPAGDLKVGDALMPLYREREKGYEKLYQPAVALWETTHRRVALTKTGLDDWPVGMVGHHGASGKRNNTPENVEIMTRSSHSKLHVKGSHTRRRMSKALRRRWRNPEYKKRVGASISVAVKKAYAEGRKIPGRHGGVRPPRSAASREKIRRAIRQVWRNYDPVARRARVEKWRAAGGWKNHRVVSVLPAGRADVYDLTVEQHHNFAVGQGVFVHNSFELVNHNALAAGANKILTRFVIGRGISFAIKDPACKAVWDEFWERNKMREKARQMARDLCLDGETRIACLDGTNPTIAELAQREISVTSPLWVYSYDAASGRVVPGKATKCWKQPAEKRCVAVTLDSGETIIASFDHPFLMRDGRYVWAERLRPNDSLMPLYRKVRKNQKYEVVLHPNAAGRSWQATHLAVLGLPPGQTVGPDFHAHHQNENKRDNRPENIEILPRRRHRGLHAAARWADPQKREQMRSAQARTRSTPEGREQQRQNALAAWRISPRQRQRRLARTRRALQAPAVRQRLSEANVRAWQDPLVRARRIASIIRAKQRTAVANHKVASVRPAGVRAVYDLQVEQHHNFALAAGVFTHNTWQGELMHHFVEKVDGFVSMRLMDPSTVWEIVTDPEDFDHIFYYHRQFPCLRGDVRIACLDGTEPTIQELAERQARDKQPVWVYSYDAKSGRIVPGKASKVWRTGRKRCVEVEIDSGARIVCSWDHPFLLRDGRYVQAEKLQSGDALMPFYQRPGYEHIWHPGPGKWAMTHTAVLEAVMGTTRQRGEADHHLNGNPGDNRPENLARMSKRAHDAETIHRRWLNPEFRDLQERWMKRASQNTKAAWKRGVYAHRCGKGARPEMREASASAARASWTNPEIRAKRITGIMAAWNGQGRRARISKAARTRARNAAGQFTPKNHKVVAVRRAGMQVVYDLHVEKYHNFALADGVFTHNTPFQIWTTGQIPVSKYIIQQIPPTQVQHVKINASSQEKRGRSDLLPAMPWLKRFNDYYNGIVVKALLEANLVYVVKVHGDQNDVNTIANDPNFTTLPPPGGMWLENEAVELKPLSAQLTAGRGSSGIGQQLASIVATSLNLPSEYFNIEAGGAARATALVRTDPAVKTIEDRQQTLKETLEDVYDRVIEAAIRSGRLSPEKARHEPERRDEPGLLAPGDEDEVAPPTSAHARPHPTRAVFRG